MTPIETVLARLDRPRRAGRGWDAFCPAHADGKNPALHLEEGKDGRALLRCAAGCATEKVVEALGLVMGDLFEAPPPGGRSRAPAPGRPRGGPPAPPPPKPADFPSLVERARALLTARRDEPRVRDLLARYHGTVTGAEAVGTGLLDDGDLRLVFPEHDARGRICGAKVRPGRDAKEQDLPGGRHGLLGSVDALKGGSHRVLLAEGGHDLLALASSGIVPEGAVPLALPGAAFFTEEAAKAWCERLGEGRHEVTLLLDADEAGRKAEKEGIAALRRAGTTVRRLEWSRFEGTAAKDLADLLAAGRGPDLAAAIEGAPGLLRFRTVEELRAMPRSQVRWLLHGLLGEGVVTVLAALMKAGKSTLIASILRALEDGEPFAGIETSRATTVYLSEEAASAILEKVDAFGVRHAVFLTREDFDPTLSFADFVSEAAAEARRRGARLLVIDTFARFSRLGADQEKDAGAVQAVFEHAMAAAATGLAVLVLTHVRKSSALRSKATLNAENVDDDPDLEEVRGSSALAAAADAVLLSKRVQDGANLRALGVLSRFSESPRGWTVLDLKDGRYEAAGSLGDVVARGAKDRVLKALHEASEPLTRDALVEAAGGSADRTRQALKELVEEGRVIRTGAGRRGDPYLYSLPEAVSRSPGLSRSEPAGPGKADESHFPDSRSRGNPGNRESASSAQSPDPGLFTADRETPSRRPLPDPDAPATPGHSIDCSCNACLPDEVAP